MTKVKTGLLGIFCVYAWFVLMTLLSELILTAFFPAGRSSGLAKIFLALGLMALSLWTFKRQPLSVALPALGLKIMYWLAWLIVTAFTVRHATDWLAGLELSPFFQTTEVLILQVTCTVMGLLAYQKLFKK